jgi:hypothetical protein
MVTCKKPKREIISNIQSLIEKGESILHLEIRNQQELDHAEKEQYRWIKYSIDALRICFDEPIFSKEFDSAGYTGVGVGYLDQKIQFEHNKNHFKRYQEAKIESLKSTIERMEFIDDIDIKSKNDATMGVLERIQCTCKNFHKIAISLQLQRHGKKPIIEIKDEYDVQYLLLPQLKLITDDIRTEEWTPSYAGSSSKMDFLLKKEKVIVETKKTRTDLRDKEIGKQLIEDIAQYRSHPDCKTLICFVYDSERLLKNPSGLIKDLDDLSTEKLKVITLIEPS